MSELTLSLGVQHPLWSELHLEAGHAPQPGGEEPQGGSHHPRLDQGADQQPGQPGEHQAGQSVPRPAHTVHSLSLVIETILGLQDLLSLLSLLHNIAAAGVTSLLHSPLINSQESNKPSDLKCD